MRFKCILCAIAHLTAELLRGIKTNRNPAVSPPAGIPIAERMSSAFVFTFSSTRALTLILKIARKINRNVDFSGFSKSFFRLSANPHRKLRIPFPYL